MAAVMYLLTLIGGIVSLITLCIHDLGRIGINTFRDVTNSPRRKVSYVPVLFHLLFTIWLFAKCAGYSKEMMGL